MASNITLSYFGPPEQKHVIKVPPMQTLSQALAAAASKFKPVLVPEQYSLQYNKKPVDLNTPFRLLNVPAGSKLEILINRAQAQAPAAGPSAGAAAPPPQQQVQSAPQPQPAAAAAAAAAAVSILGVPTPAAQAPVLQTATQATPQQQQQQVATPAAAPAAAPAPIANAQVSARPASTSAAAPATAAGVHGPSSSTVQAAPSSSAAATAEDAPGPLSALGVKGQVYVYNQRTLEAAAQGPKPMDVDPPDDFFELTTEDLVRIQQEANRKKQADTVFKPRAMREAEEAARASSLGPIRVRLHFPDATIIQATFSASQPLSAVQQMVTQIAPEAVAPALYLYTTPPKTVLKDPMATLYQLQLVPAAHLYVGCEPKKLKAQAAAAAAGGSYQGPFLRPEVLALMQDTLPEQHTNDQQQQQQSVQEQQQEAVTAADAQRAMALAAAARRAEAGGSSRAAAGGGGAKVPKWLKMGK